jgi:predicted NBD/HSP70 family sugar kinase
MNTRSLVQPALLSRINERQVVRTIQAHGPLSRAEVARLSGITPPTVSKAVEALLEANFLEEDSPQFAPGRPAKKLRLAASAIQVLGLVIDAEYCRVVSAGLDGNIHPDQPPPFRTPETYEQFLDAAVESIAPLLKRSGITTLGLGISIPGLIDYRHNQGLLSPNVPITNRHTPGQDIEQRLGVACRLIQEEHALCLAERAFGNARGLDDFAILDVSTGVGLGVMSGGRLLTGHCGLAGEIGHITVDIAGRKCGCGNYGCLETVACDSALAWRLSQRLGRRVNIEEVIESVQSGELNPTQELETLCQYLAVGLAAVINLFNPSSLFVHGRLFELDSNLFSRLLAETQKRALAPSFDACRIIQARGSKRQGAIAAIIDHLIESIVPVVGADHRRSQRV